jgi:cation transport ATPase
MASTSTREYTPNERVLLAIATLIVTAAGLACRPISAVWAGRIWLGGLVATGAPIVWRTILETRRGRWATDVVAMLAIVAAVVLREPLAGLVIVLMRSGGEALEEHAAGRASAALRELEDAAPRIAHRLLDGDTRDIKVGEIAVGDLLLVRPGEVIPCDGVVTDGDSLVDTSRLTGEPVPVSAAHGTAPQRQHQRQWRPDAARHGTLGREPVREDRRART